jgi:hypothetical protein
LKEIEGFQHCISLCRIKIPSLVEQVRYKGFFGCISLNEIIFSRESHLRELDGFEHCTSLSRIEIPSSVEQVKYKGFFGCISLNEIVFSRASHLREIDGFGNCTSLSQIEIPSSVEKIASDGLLRCPLLCIVVIHGGCRLKINRELQLIKAFIVYEDSKMKNSRHLIHFDVGGRGTRSWFKPF